MCSEEEPGGPRGREEGDIARVPARLLPPPSPPPLPAPPPQEGNEGSGGEVQPPRVVPRPPRQPRLEGAAGQDGRTDRFLLHHRPLLPGDQEKAQGEGDGWWRPVVVVAAAIGFQGEPAPKLLPLARQPSQNAPNDPLPWDDS